MRIFFSVGEPSGDQHASRLIGELQERCPEIQPEGFGGPAMRAAGCRLLFELTELAVMGFLRVLPMLARFRRLVKMAEAHFDAKPPDAVVVVDFPGFNWWIARAAKLRGIPVYYYLPPQLWGWAPWRIRRVRKWVDHVICALPFEYEWYRSRGVRATWVGHPFFDAVAENPFDTEIVARLRTSDGRPTVALLPGSRRHEVEKNWPVIVRVMQTVSVEVPDVRWIVGNYRPEHEVLCRSISAALGVENHPEYLIGKTSEVIEAADCCLMVSGSISLELLARRTPGIVLYRVPRIGRAASMVLMNCRFITLTNLIADHEVMPEFISHGNPARDIQGMAQKLTEWLIQPRALEAVRNSMTLLAGHATNQGASRRTAELLLTEIAYRSRSSASAVRAA